MIEMKISEILENCTGISGFGGQVTEDNLLEYVKKSTRVDTTLSGAGKDRFLNERILSEGKFLFAVQGLGWVTAFCLTDIDYDSCKDDDYI